MSRLATLAFAIALASCGDATGLLVEVGSSDLSIPADVDALRFQAVSAETRTMVDRTFAVSTTWPHSLTITPASESDRQLTITVTGLKEGRFVVRRVVRAELTRGVTNRISVVLSRACRDMMCPDGVDCVAGMCVDQPPMDGGVDGGMRDGGPPRDAGSDAGRDAGDEDAAMPRDGGRDAGPVDGGPPDTGPPDTGPVDAGAPVLFFSEYIEEASNKAIEIVNVGGSPADLSRCQVERYSNGSSSAFVIPLSGTLAPGDVYALCSTGLVGASTICDQVTGSISHNGDDAYALACDGARVDIFGCIGHDPDSGEPPTTGWSGGGLQTADFVLYRMCSITMGNTSYDSMGSPPCSPPFDPSVEWTGMAWSDPATSLVGLGNRMECP